MWLRLIRILAFAAGLAIVLLAIVNWVTLDRFLQLSTIVLRQTVSSPSSGLSKEPIPPQHTQQLTVPETEKLRTRPDSSKKASLTAKPAALDDGAMGYDLVDVLSAALAEDFPDLKLTDADLLTLSEAILTIRESLQGLRSFDRSAATAREFEQLSESRDKAIAEFERITGMSLAEFMRRAAFSGGIDN